MKEKELEKLQCGRLRFTLQLVNSESHVMRYTARPKETGNTGLLNFHSAAIKWNRIRGKTYPNNSKDHPSPSGFLATC